MANNLFKKNNDMFSSTSNSQISNDSTSQTNTSQQPVLNMTPAVGPYGNTPTTAVITKQSITYIDPAKQIMNISNDNVAGKCDLKCMYNFNYTGSTTNAKNEGFSITLTYERSKIDPVNFNNNKYYVQRIILYSPSIHLFYGSKSTAELVIEHYPSNGGQLLNVAIPIIKSSDYTSASTLLANIINSVALNAPSQGETTTINTSNFSLQKIVPKKPFYSYTESSGIDWIVYGKENAISLNDSAISTLNKIISPETDLLCPAGPLLFFNSKGPSSVLGDDIYIDCKPVGASDETVQVEEYTSNGEDFMKPETFNMIMKIVMGCILFILILVVLYYGFNKLSNLKVSSGFKIPGVSSNNK